MIFDEIEIIEYLDSILDSSSMSTSIISDNKLNLYIDGLDSFELTVRQIGEE